MMGDVLLDLLESPRPYYSPAIIIWFQLPIQTLGSDPPLIFAGLILLLRELSFTSFLKSLA